MVIFFFCSALISSGYTDIPVLAMKMSSSFPVPVCIHGVWLMVMMMIMMAVILYYTTIKIQAQFSCFTDLCVRENIQKVVNATTVHPTEVTATLKQ